MNRLLPLSLTCLVLSASAIAQTTPSKDALTKQKGLADVALKAVRNEIGLVEASGALPTDEAVLKKIAGDQECLEALLKIDPAKYDDAFKILSDLTKSSSDPITRLGRIRDARIRLRSAHAALLAMTKTDGYEKIADADALRVEVRDLLERALDELETKDGRKAFYGENLGDVTAGKSVAKLVEFYAARTKESADTLLGSLATDPKDDALLGSLPGGITEFAESLPKQKAARDRLTEVTEKFKPLVVLLPAVDSKTELDSFKARVDTLGKRSEAVAKSLADWIGKLAEQCDKNDLTVLKKTSELRRRQAGAAAYAYVQRDETEALILKLRAGVDRWNGAKDAISAIYKESAAATQIKADLLAKSIDGLSVDVSGLQSLLRAGGGDMVTQEVRLSFFPDTARLVRFLNPTAQVIDPTSGQAAIDFDRARAELRKAEKDLLGFQTELAAIKTRIQRINAEISRARADSERTSNLFQKATGQKAGLIDARTDLEAAKTKAVTPEEILRLDEQIKAVRAKEALQDEVVTAATKDNSDAQSRLTALLDENNGLPASRKLAETALLGAETSLNNLRASVPALAQDENAAFARQRDNAPYLIANPIFDENDPARRVFLMAEIGGRVLHIRGNIQDVLATREIVAEFDKPAPQTKLTFYTIQVNGDDKPGDGEKGMGGKSARTVEMVEESLDRIRIGTTTVIDALRQAISDEVNRVARKQPNVSGRIARYSFYAESVRQTLGAVNLKEDATLQLTRFTLPDPVRLTTLGEMFFVLALGSDESREKILESMRDKIAVSALGLRETGADANAARRSASGPQPKASSQIRSRDRINAIFRAFGDSVVGTLRTLRFDQPSSLDGLLSLQNILALSRQSMRNTVIAPNMTAAQREIADALLAKARTDVASTIHNLVHQIDALPEEIRYDSPVAMRLRNQYAPLIGWLASRETQSGISGNWKAEGFEILGVAAWPTDRDGLVRCDRIAFEFARTEFTANPLSKATGRIEAADKMIRGMIDAFNDDLDRTLRRPAMEAIRESINSLQGVSLGAVEETSFLATNRRVSRVDPVGSGSLSADEQLGAADASRALSGLLAQQKARSETKDGILGAALGAAIGSNTGGSGPALGGALGITALLENLLGGTPSAPSPTSSEVYSISSGNVYKITPIFDPTGQGMRFNFDFVATTKVREPGGTINPALPRIERHSINTEVTVNNLETRQIGSFDTNYQIGLPEQRSGGIPLINTLPGLRDIPIVGYFTKREGKPAQRQRSIVLAHSVMYPTIADIAGLMLDAAPAPFTFSPEIPSTIKLASERARIKSIEVSPEKPSLLDPIIVRVHLNRPLAVEARVDLKVVGGSDFELPQSGARVVFPGQDTIEYLLVPLALTSVSMDFLKSLIPYDPFLNLTQLVNPDESPAARSASVQADEKRIQFADGLREKVATDRKAVLAKYQLRLIQNHLLQFTLEEKNGYKEIFNRVVRSDNAAELVRESFLTLSGAKLTATEGQKNEVSVTLSAEGLGWHCG